MSPKVAITCPVFNGSRSIARQLDSIAAQTYADWRAYIIDNASTDETRSICLQYAQRDERFVYLPNDKNRGLPFSLRRGFYLSHDSKYGIYASSNDYWDPQYLAECVQALEKDPEAVIAYSYCQLINPDGSLRELYSDDFDLAGPSPEQRYLTVLECMGLCTAYYGLMRMTAYCDCERFAFNQPSAAGDNLMLAAMAIFGKIVQIPRPLFFREMPARDADYQARKERLSQILMPQGDQAADSPAKQPFLDHIRAHIVLVNVLLVIDPDVKGRLIQRTVQAILARYRDSLEADLTNLVESVCAGLIYPSPENPHAPRQTMGRVPLMDFGVLDLLLDYLNFAANFFSAFPGLYLAQAIIYIALGRQIEARAALKMELKNHPTSRQALELSAKLEPL